MQVVIILGSASDIPVVQASGISDTLTDIGITSSCHVYSAHRNADELAELCRSSVKSGTKVFVGGAGMAAALPGAIAANTDMSVPVLGVPLDEHGIDSCLYMPPGVPVMLTGVGKSGFKNAALAAAQIVATGDETVAKALAAYIARNRKAPQANVDLKEK